MLKSGGQAIVLVRLCVLLASPCVCCSRIALCACLAAAGRAVLALQSELHFASVRQSMELRSKARYLDGCGGVQRGGEATRSSRSRHCCCHLDCSQRTHQTLPRATCSAPATLRAHTPPAGETVRAVPCPRGAWRWRAEAAVRRCAAAECYLCSVHAAMPGARPVRQLSSLPAQCHNFTHYSDVLSTCDLSRTSPRSPSAALAIVATFRTSGTESFINQK